MFLKRNPVPFLSKKNSKADQELPLLEGKFFVHYAHKNRLTFLTQKPVTIYAYMKVSFLFTTLTKTG